MPAPTLVWFRLDLRLDDQPALRYAAQRGGPVVPVFLWAPEEEGEWRPGAASNYFLHQCLLALEGELVKHHSRLIYRQGPALETLRALVRETGADAVVWNRRYEPAAIARDTAVKKALREEGLEVRTFNGALLNEPHEIQNKQGEPYKVFTQYWKTATAQYPVAEPKPAPDIPAPDSWPASLRLEELGLEPTIDWARGIRAAWSFGARGAQEELGRFLEEGLIDYKAARDIPAQRGTSRLSPHLHFGTISPRQVYHAAAAQAAAEPRAAGGAAHYHRELYWREFGHHLLFHFPHTTNQPLMERFAAFPWDDDTERLRRWQRGETGYPIVDAAMRELWETGWMHNRTRMIVASFLVKDLRLHWLEGARWFWDTLVDADLANNTLGWQWAAGCGADAAPYFRVFNPMLQSKKFDGDGAYVRRYVPALRNLPAEHLHAPWEAPPQALAQAGVALGDTYPAPVVDHAAARDAALKAYEKIKG